MVQWPPISDHRVWRLDMLFCSTSFGIEVTILLGLGTAVCILWSPRVGAAEILTFEGRVYNSLTCFLKNFDALNVSPTRCEASILRQPMLLPLAISAASQKLNLYRCCHRAPLHDSDYLTVGVHCAEPTVCSMHPRMFKSR